MTENTSYAVHKLTEPWTLILASEGYTAREFPPLLTILEGLVASSNNSHGGGGLAHTRNLVDTKALTLLMLIQDVVGGWLFEWDAHAVGLIPRVVKFAETLDTRWRTSQISETGYLSLSAGIEDWARKIWTMYEPSKRIPLRGVTCPVCQRAKYVNDAEEASDPLIVTFGDTGEPRADCQWSDCATAWTGTESLIALGNRIGATLDPDALREMGVIA